MPAGHAEYTAFMIFEYSGQGFHRMYSCPICKGHKTWSAAWGHARKHYEKHVKDGDVDPIEIRKKYLKWLNQRREEMGKKRIEYDTL